MTEFAELKKRIEDLLKQSMDELEKLVDKGNARHDEYALIRGMRKAYFLMMTEIENLERQRENSEGNGQIRLHG